MTDEKYVPPARCPWCGGHARVCAFTDGNCVECDRCHASGPMTMFGERAAITAWNKVASRVAAGTPRDNEGVDYASLAGVNEHLRKSLSIAYETNDSYRDEYTALKCSHERTRRVWDATAEHLRKARERLRTATCQIESARISGKFFEGKYYELMDDLHGDEEPVDVPEHYRGDCVVSAARALRSVASQPTKTERTETAFYWWALAFKYVWRLWSKGQAERDAEKAIDCLKRVIGELDEGEEA